jgi:serine/threonine protein phosphatase PrpC
MATKRLTLVAFLFVFTFAANLLFLVVFFPPFQQYSRHVVISPQQVSEQSNRILESKKAPPKFAFSSNKRKTTLTACPSYGCPRYPPELTAALNSSLVTAFQQNLPSSSFDTFATESFAMLTQQGKSHKENQDRGVFISPFVIGDDKDAPPSFLAAIFDGHGLLGHLVAQEVMEVLPNVLCEKLRQKLTEEKKWWQEDDNDLIVTEALKETFIHVNNQGTEYNFLRGGCTASVTLRYGSKLFIANTGDSQSVIVSIPPGISHNNPKSTTKARVEFMTRKDKPYEEDELERINRMGGKIHINPLHPKDARVVVKSLAQKGTIALAMSRSIGDLEWKEVGVIPDPIVNIVDLNEPQYAGMKMFLISASDGMWDVRKQEFYANQFGAIFDTAGGKLNDKTAASASGAAPPKNPKLRPIFKLHDIFCRITPKVQKGYCDDITAIIAQLY